MVVKGYRDEYEQTIHPIFPPWKYGKGKPPLINQDCLYEKYLQLWVDWAENNQDLIDELYDNCKNKILTDMFASSNISQARSLCEILNAMYHKKNGLF